MWTKSVRSDELPELPREIWREIGRRNRSRLDVTRFRSVCRIWRSSLPPPTLFPLQVPTPPGPFNKRDWTSYIPFPIPFLKKKDPVSCFISEITFYAPNVHGSAPKIVAFEEMYTGGKFSASAFLHQKQIHHTPLFLRPVTDLPNLQFLANAFHLHYSIPQNLNQKSSTSAGKCDFMNNCNVLKLVIISSDCSTSNPNYSRLCDLKVIAHLYYRRLAVLSLDGGAMNNKWVTNFSSNSTFEDIINYKGQLYAVNQLGVAFVMDYESLQMTQVAAALPNFHPLIIQGKRKIMHLSEVEGNLYLVCHDSEALPDDSRLYRLGLSGLWIQIPKFLPPYIFLVDARTNFAVRRTLIPRHSYNNALPEIKLPCVCSWPDFLYIRITVGFRYIDPPKVPRLCDCPELLYFFLEHDYT